MVNTTKLITMAGRQIAVPSAATINSVFGPSIAHLSDEQISKIQRYTALLLLWNEKLNLTAIEDPFEIISRHFGESFSAVPHIPAKSRLADVGSGAGFPGLALKIFQPNLQVLLIEQNSKRAAFLNEAIRTVDLVGISVFRGNYLELPSKIAPFDSITARALGKYRELLNWARGRLSETGKIALWLGAEESLKLSKVPGWLWDQSIRISESRRRQISIGKPI